MFGFSVAFHSSSAGLSKVKKSYVKLGESYGKLQKLQTGTAIPHGDVRALAGFTSRGVISNRKEAFGQMHGEIPQAHGGRPRSSGPFTSTKEIPEWLKPGPHVEGCQNLIPPSTRGERKEWISTTFCMKGMAWWYGMR